MIPTPIAIPMMKDRRAAKRNSDIGTKVSWGAQKDSIICKKRFRRINFYLDFGLDSFAAGTLVSANASAIRICF